MKLFKPGIQINFHQTFSSNTKNRYQFPISIRTMFHSHASSLPNWQNLISPIDLFQNARLTHVVCVTTYRLLHYLREKNESYC